MRALVILVFLVSSAHQNLQWSLSHIHAQQAWSITTGKGAVICDVDTGVAPIPDLAGQVIGGINETDPRHPTDYFDGNSHGTFTAAEMVATGGDTRGVAPDAQLLVAKVLDDTGSGTTESVTAGMLWCIDHHANAVNLSLGGDAASYDGEADIIDYGCGRGVMFGVAAGNDGGPKPNDPAQVDSPCLIAVNSVDRHGNLSSFSNYSENTREISAPGENVIGDWYAGGIASFSGTSMAAPYVTATEALLASLHVPARQAVRLILATAHRNWKTKLVPNEYGAGILDVGAAVARAHALGYTAS